MLINGANVEIQQNWSNRTDLGYKIRTEGYTADIVNEDPFYALMQYTRYYGMDSQVRKYKGGTFTLNQITPTGTPLTNWAMGGYVYVDYDDDPSSPDYGMYHGFGIRIRFKSWLNQQNTNGYISFKMTEDYGTGEHDYTLGLNGQYKPEENLANFIIGGQSGGTDFLDNLTLDWSCDLFPVFETIEDLDDYLSSPNDPTKMAKALNFSDTGDIEDTSFDYEITNPYNRATWNSYGPSDTDIEGYRNVKFKMSRGHKICLYPVGGYNAISDRGTSASAIKYKLLYRGSFEAVSYSTDDINWTDTNTMPWTEFYRRRDKELGTFTYGIAFYHGKIPIFGNPAKAEGYVDGDVPITEADNWPEISPNYPILNDSGEDDPDTDFGDVYTKSFFTQQYLCTEATVQEISNKLYNIGEGGIWEQIKQGIEMFGDNPIESVSNLTYYPLDLSEVFTNTAGAASSVFFGGYELELELSQANKILYPNGSFSCGSVFIERSFKNYRDMPPYTRLWVDLPYCGRYELDPTKYLGKYVEVRYFIDTRTGACNCCLITSDSGLGGHLADSYNGQIGTQLPVRMTDFTSFANNQINTLLGNGGQATNLSMDVGKAGAQAGMSGSAIGIVGAGVGAATLGALQGAKTVYGLAQNNINRFNQTRGGSTAMLNQYLNQTPCFTLEVLEIDIPSNYYNMVGGPSNAGGNIGSFSGYLECDQVRLNVTGATETEKEKIRALLMGGVYL